jgi:UDP-2-acetamido-3-amino-2,3-dideoxy-glucuronate N-acetyltransferase
LTARAEHRGTDGGPLQKIALIGYGRWGSNVARDLASTEGAALTHVVDVSPQALSRAAKAHPSAAVATRLADVLGAVDAVAICTPPATHAALAAAALAESKHVFVEKPIAMDLSAATQLEAAAETRQRVLMVGHQMLYHRAFEALVRAVTSSELGALRAVRSERSGMVDSSRDPDVLWAYGPHDVAMLLALAGRPPSEVRAAGSVRSGTSEIEDVTLELRFDGGLTCTTLLRVRSGARVRRLTAICERGEVVFDDSVPRGTCAIRRDGEVGIVAPGPEDGDGRLPLARELADFVACAATGALPRSDGRHAIQVTRVLVEAERMIAASRPATSSFRLSRALS